MKKIIVCLGNSNDESGELSKVATERCDQAHKIWSTNRDFDVLLTAGFGKHFNTSAQPHATYTQRYLIQKGIPEETFLPPVLSANTYEDFKLMKKALEPFSVKTLIVVTSDFHLYRCKFLFNEFINHPNTIFLTSETVAPEVELEKLYAHEKRAMEQLIENFSRRN